ncbi:MAG: peptide chain release factor N(5)-glutamine methyltransferase [Myxococcota bacterium]|nr:peptide chain release factor N(5)-glutamine methyltransferase [Myxococcota bacterium]
MPPQHSLAELLKTTADYFTRRGVETARLDAELLLGDVLGLDRLQLYTSFDRPLSSQEVDRYRALVRRRAEREPVAYILGRKEFYSRTFEVDPRVLIPRPDTETLVDAVLAVLPEEAEGLVLDYGTGSGAIALTLAAERLHLRVLAIDISNEALSVARANADKLALSDRVGFIQSDGLERVPARFEGQVAALVSNPPYIAVAERNSLAPEIRDYEPEDALFAGSDPLLHYRRIATEAPRWMTEGGLLALEVGGTQAADVTALLRKANWQSIELRSDLAGKERVVLARWLS